MKNFALIIAVLGLSACSAVQYTPATQQATEVGVRVLYEYPQDAAFKSLGTINADVYRPGFRAPTVADVLPELKAKASSAGGNALIVRSHQVGQFDRSISVTAEVLSVEWSVRKN